MRTMEQIRDDLIARVDEHRANCTHPVCLEEINAIAFLAHCLGLRADSPDLALFPERLEYYEDRCPDCAHRRN